MCIHVCKLGQDRPVKTFQGHTVRQESGAALFFSQEGENENHPPPNTVKHFRIGNMIADVFSLVSLM